MRDLKFAIRMIARKPGFAAVAILTLALGIGANSAIFTLIRAVLLRPLPFKEPHRLVMVWEDATFIGFPFNTPAFANYRDWKTQNSVFEEMAAISDTGYSLTGDGEPLKVTGYRVTHEFFPILGVQPRLGRVFTAEDDRPQAPSTAVISYSLWQSRYGGEESIIGREILLDRKKYTVVGVMPRNFEFLRNYVSVWTPMAATEQEMSGRGSHYLEVVARMKPGVAVSQAQSDIAGIQERIAHDFPDAAAKIGARVVPLSDQLVGDSGSTLVVLLVAVALVLLIACANIASLLLARATGRTREIGVRLAIGASRLHIVRQLLIESAVLSVAGGLLGLMLSSWSLEFLKYLVPPTLALSVDLSTDLPVLSFTLALSLLTAFIFGVAPALQTSRLNLNEALKQGGRTGVSASSRRIRGLLVIGETALAVMLLAGAGLLMQTILKLHGQYDPLRPESLLTLRTALSDNSYAEHSRRINFYKSVLERVRALPGVVSAGYTTSVPLEWKGGTNGFEIEGRVLDRGEFNDANHRQVTPDYLSTMGLAVKEGRLLNESDNQRSMPVTVINETMARQYWPGETSVGKRIRLGTAPTDPWFTIVGVVEDVRQMGVDVPVKAEAYFPFDQIDNQRWYAPRDLVIRTSVPPLALVEAVRNEIKAVDPQQPVSNVRTMAQVLGEETEQRRVGTIMVAVFAGVALLLASLGTYGVLAYSVSEQTRDIGLRMALGASRGNVLGMVLASGMKLAIGGVGLGLVAAFALTRLMARMLYGVGASDPLTFIAVSLILLFVAFVSCYVPARRAMKVDPMVALRYE